MAKTPTIKSFKQALEEVNDMYIRMDGTKNPSFTWKFLERWIKHMDTQEIDYKASGLRACEVYLLENYKEEFRAWVKMIQ